MSIESVMPSSHLILCHPLLLLPPIPPSIRVISNESTIRMRWPKYWSFSFRISPSKEHPGMSSFRMDWLDLLAVRESQESSPKSQFKSINSSGLSLLHSPTLRSIHDHWRELLLIMSVKNTGICVIPFSRGSFWPSYWTWVSCIASRLFTVWATRDALIEYTTHYNFLSTLSQQNKCEAKTLSNGYSTVHGG